MILRTPIHRTRDECIEEGRVTSLLGWAHSTGDDYDDEANSLNHSKNWHEMMKFSSKSRPSNRNRNDKRRNSRNYGVRTRELMENEWKGQYCACITLSDTLVRAFAQDDFVPLRVLESRTRQWTMLSSAVLNQRLLKGEEEVEEEEVK